MTILGSVGDHHRDDRLPSMAIDFDCFKRMCICLLKRSFDWRPLRG